MAESDGLDGTPSAGGSEGGDAARTDISLDQALLAPLDSILKAQLHSARSFLNLLLQLGYRDQSDPEFDGKPFSLSFNQEGPNGEIHEVTVPALSLVPIAPLAVSSANFDLEMAVRKIARARQLRASAVAEEDAAANRPWYLVDKPVDIRGVIAPPSAPAEAARQESMSSIKIHIEVKSVPMPSGLDKLLTSLTQMGQVSERTPPAPDDGTSAAERKGEL
ncbi:DUF2589 domain-containing protein [Motiliproteus sediminis]|uniref:DUF2589 domain-containing protein n=1 Tax=Motiliproteus sediminis TaxID=1468178 RepID=UPI001AF01634|nr:DUF2589 domain-containing protein [Motiliproteus sediminis]